MNDETHLVDEASLRVTSLKQQALVKIATSLIFADLEDFCDFSWSLFDYPFTRLSKQNLDLKQLCGSDICQRDIRHTIMFLYLNLELFHGVNSFPPTMVKFNGRGDLDVQRTFDDYLKHLLTWPRIPRKYLFDFLKDACRWHQEQYVHVMLCELAKWKRSGLEPFLRKARPEVEVLKGAEWCYDISFVIEDLDDPAPWTSFVTMLNNNLGGSMFSFGENILKVSTIEYLRNEKMVLLWPKMTTIVKFEHAAEIFKIALDQSYTCLLVQTMHYLESTNRMQLIKANLVSFILCFMTCPYYRSFLPDLPLVTEDIELLSQEVIHKDFRTLLWRHVGDYTNFSDCLVQLWNYFAVRDDALGEHVFSNIRECLYNSENAIDEWFDHEDDEAEKALTKLREIFAPDLLYDEIE